MKKEEVEKFIEQIKPMFNGCELEVVDVVGDIVKLKMNSQNLGIFKVQGKIINTDNELRPRVIQQIKMQFPSAKVEFV